MVRRALILLFAGAAAAGPLTDARRPEARKRQLRALGGSAATEKAVARALGWLARHQSGDGSWDVDGFMHADGCDCDGKGGGWHGERVPSPFDTEVTALATLAFLGAGHTHKRGPYRSQVARALERLERGGGTLFAMAYSTQAWAEAYDLTGDEKLKQPIERGIRVMIESRQPRAGWRYYAGSRMASGVPTTTAVVVALHAAERAGVAVPADYKQPVLDWLDRLADPRTDRVAYTLDAHRAGLTPTTTNAASALWIRTLLEVPLTDRRIRSGLRALAKRPPKWFVRFRRMKVKGVVRNVQIGYLQHYYWLHGTEALARIGGDAWKSWNGALKRALLPKQRKAGHAAGSWDPVGSYGKVGGRVFSTALCALMLESYYRAG